ncbi:hypothetical protein G5B37_11845 [Rasiella rasia]|uniref:TonB C-terminal domain-containing protein n=1 Tax=Rasiella rasia TaxID=2744027 RepID=A0A6G6GNX5_9FLAO|nr:energy transducer TonB [Rasiella rasia]QIE60227.1 hypothetical protein G5B37_11845 [Rasiella rasia]
MLRLLPFLFLFNSFSLLAQLEIVPFSQMDNPPAFQGCVSDTKEISTACTQEAIDAFARNKFNTGLFKGLNLNEKRVRLYAQFTIDTAGSIKDIVVRTAHPQLEKEIKRVLKLAPRFRPGTHEGKPSAAKYTLPLVFTLG